jgi:plastocyanin
MVYRSRNWIAVGALALTALAPASAQAIGPAGLPELVSPAQAISPATPGSALGRSGRARLGWAGLSSYTGLVTPFGFRTPVIPTDRFVPAYPLIAYPVPQAVYVPVPVRQEPPSVAPVQVTQVTLGRSGTPASVQVKQGTVVSWVNPGERAATVVVDPERQPGIPSGAGRQQGVARPNESFSLVFHQPGVYEYYTQDQPARRAKVVVTE